MKRPARIARTVVEIPERKRAGDSKAHLRFVKSLPCLVTGLPADDPHHLFTGMQRGVGLKAEDRWAVPVTRKIHDECHASGNDEQYFADKGFDARAVANALWRVSGDYEAGLRVIERARQDAHLKLRLQSA